jgi:flagellar protein FliJ
MKSFSFNLEAVLLVRTREQQTAAEAWALALQAKAHAEENLVNAREEMERQQNALCHLRGDRFQPGDQAMYLNAMAFQKNICDRMVREARKAEGIVRRRQADLLEAKMKRDVLTHLKEKKMNEYRSELRAHEEAAIDELVVARHGRGRAGV